MLWPSSRPARSAAICPSVLATRAATSKRASASHRGKGWEEVTARAIDALAERAADGQPLVAILWGRDARNLAPSLRDVPRIESPHPSPLSASSGFFGSRPFSRTNAALEAAGADPIDWSLP